MAILNYNEVKQRKVILFEGEPYQVLDSHVFRKQQRKPVNQTKLKNLITGKVMEYSFHQSETVEEADLEFVPLTFIYSKGDEWWFYRNSDKSDRISLSGEIVGTACNYLIGGTEATGVVFDDEIIGLSIPIKMQFRVTDAPPNIKGNTASGGTKPVTIETGATINTPFFIETGDTIEVNTETGEYVTRVEKR